MNAIAPKVRRGTKEEPSAGQTPQAGATPPASTTTTTAAVQEGMTENEVKSIVTSAVTDAIKAQLPEHLKSQVTPESIREIVSSEIAKLNTGSKGISAADVKAIAEASAKAGMDSIRREAKPTKDQADAGKSIEMPYSLSRGNLPPHMVQLKNIIMRKPMNEGLSETDLQNAKSQSDRFFDRLGIHGHKALTSTGSNAGDEFVPTDLGAELQRRFYLSSPVAQLMLAREVMMPTNPYKLPLSTTRPTFYLNNTENSAQTESAPATDSVTLTAARLATKVLFSYELEEDSIIAILPWVQEQLGIAAADAYEDALINGDTTATHMDTDTNAVSGAAAKAWKGLRKLALAGSLKVDFSTGGLSAANLRALIKLMDKYAVDKQNLVWLAGVKGTTDLMGISEVLTQDKFGPRATIATGQLQNLYGIPIVTSARVREDLDATGVNSANGANNVKGSVLLVNLTGFLAGRRREFMVETDRDIDKQQNIVVASFRRAFAPVETPSTTISTLAVGYNYTA